MAGAGSGREVTYLFTDVEGSTPLVEKFGDVYATALSQHRRLLRRACAEHHGDELGTAGDGFFAVFATSADAVAAAVDAQRALRSHDWPDGCELSVRMGLHRGEERIEAGDHVGIAIHAAARVCSAAHGGQIIATRAVMDDADKADARSLGLFPLKGVTGEIELFQLLHPSLPADFAPPRVSPGDDHPGERSRSTRVLIVDDQELVRTGFNMILGAVEGLTVVGDASDGDQAVDAVHRLKPDVVLMDIRMPNMNGIDATRHITALDDPPKVIILSTFDLDEYVYDALRAGASAFLLKDAPPKDVVRAIEVVSQGESLLAPSITKRLVEQFATEPQPAEPAADGGADEAVATLAGLTEREHEVLREIGRGLTNAELAETLFISEATVKTHVRSLLSKLGARDRVQLVITAYQNGLVDSA